MLLYVQLIRKSEVRILIVWQEENNGIHNMKFTDYQAISGQVRSNIPFYNSKNTFNPWLVYHGGK
jgi:hypothetical protein